MKKKIIFGTSVLLTFSLISCTEYTNKKDLKALGKDYCDCVKEAKEYKNYSRKQSEQIECMDRYMKRTYNKINEEVHQKDKSETERIELINYWEEQINKCE